MAHIVKNLAGKGILSVEGKSIGDVSYDITIMAEPGLKSASGSIEGDMAVIMPAFSAGKAQLRLREGANINIVVTEVYAADGSASIVVSGPIPGY